MSKDSLLKKESNMKFWFHNIASPHTSSIGKRSATLLSTGKIWE